MHLKKYSIIFFMALLLVFTPSCKKSEAGNASDTDSQIETPGKSQNEVLVAPIFGICSAEKALELAKGSDVVLMENSSVTSGKALWNEFYKKVSDGIPATVICASYYTESFPETTDSEEIGESSLYWSRIEYDGRKYTLCTRKSTEKENSYKETFEFLSHFSEEYSTLRKVYDYYVLVDDRDLTWDNIIQSMYSSNFNDYIKMNIVYTDVFYLTDK